MTHDRDQPANGPHIRAWGFFALLLFIASISAFAPIPHGSRVGVIGLLRVIAAFGAFAAAAVLTRKSDGREQRTWRLFSVALLLLTAYEALRIGFSLALMGVGGSQPAYALLARTSSYLVLVPVLLLATVSYEVVAYRKLRNTLDLLTMVVWVFAVTAIMVMAPLIAGTATPATVLPASAFFVANVAFALYMLAFKQPPWRAWHILLAAAFIPLAASDLLFAYLMGTNSLRPGTLPTTLVGLGFVLGYGLLFMAPAHRLNTKHVRVHRVRRPELDLPRWPGITALVAALVGVPFFFIWAERLSGDDPGHWILVGSGTLLAVLTVARSAVISFENRSILASNVVDPISGTYNHRYFKERLASECAHAGRANESVTVALFDIVEFHTVNSSEGHRVGDALLHVAGSRLVDGVRADDTVARVAGDTFAVLLAQTDAVEAFATCSRLQASLEKPNDVSSCILRTTVGLATLPLCAQNAPELMRDAEGALYWGKRHAKGDIVIFDPETIDVYDSAEHVAKIEDLSHTRLVEALAAAVDARDSYTRFHSSNVAALVAPIAREVGMTQDEIDLLESAALLHDVGKIGIPDAILTKPGRLTDEEYERIKEHPALGVGILSASAREEMLPWIECHHEFWDGTGYPRGLSGESIPLESRILSLCDAFDAMTSDRPYREGRSVEAAAQEIERCAGTQFDPELALIFVRHVRNGSGDLSSMSSVGSA